MLVGDSGMSGADQSARSAIRRLAESSVGKKEVEPPSIGNVISGFRLIQVDAMLDIEGDRHRGFFTTMLDSRDSVLEWISNVMGACVTPTTRITVQVPISHRINQDWLRTLRYGHGDRVLRCEGIVPAQHHEIAAFAYFGWVAPERAQTPQTVLGEWTMLEQSIDACEPQQVSTDRVEILSNPTEKEIKQLVEIYRCFDRYLCDLTSMDEVRAMVTGSLTVVVRDSDRIIVGVAIAEAIEFNRTAPAAFVEISDVAVHPRARRQGIAKMLYVALINECRMRFGEDGTTITTQIRSRWGALNRTMLAVGMQAYGFLPSQCAIQCTSAQDTLVHMPGGASIPRVITMTQVGEWGDLTVCAVPPVGLFRPPTKGQHPLVEWFAPYLSR